ncbi:endonuclease/exonuclease/phosphatase family protein [Microbacterium oryzae]|uniref:Endonuclease/exonuclease/phosphatase family protein n=1 Tax=Microbacterium oryzae TaxID=743009 RepID=A0A6I6DU10_9MICO|nr:endonuclease/exonuclease/phosphatase family protein [Microbacterium oryzae]QGU28495.1 endonuclease/exonuclease/phosphatase family protein [Microbacterium oryzae]
MTTPLIGPRPAPDLAVMTFNIRRAMDGRLTSRADRWSHRLPALQTLLHLERPTLVGVQEALPRAGEAVRAALGDGYRLLGRGRNAKGQGEGVPIVYDAERLEAESWSQEALSDRPHTAGSIGWGNRIPRVLVAAVFRDLATSARFLAVNTHLDVFSARSRVRAARAIRERVATQPLPALVMGDMNAPEGSPAITTLLENGRLVDAWRGAAIRLTPAWGTYGAYRSPRENGKRIDWIVTTPDVDVREIAIDGRPVDGRWPSDHLPVSAVVRIPGGAS